MNRVERAGIQPSHGSIFLWLPYFTVNVGGAKIGAQTILLIISLLALMYLTYRKKIDCLLAISIISIVSTVFTTDGSLDRNIVGCIPLIIYLASNMPKQMIYLGILNNFLALIFVFTTRAHAYSIKSGIYSLLFKTTDYTYQRNEIMQSASSEYLDGLFILLTVITLFTLAYFGQKNNSATQNKGNIRAV